MRSTNHVQPVDIEIGKPPPTGGEAAHVAVEHRDRKGRLLDEDEPTRLVHRGFFCPSLVLHDVAIAVAHRGCLLLDGLRQREASSREFRPPLSRQATNRLQSVPPRRGDPAALVQMLRLPAAIREIRLSLVV